jgi:DnaJ-like protein
MDFYTVLQVYPDADDEVIDAAYRQLMKKYHPDRAAGDPNASARLHERAKRINEAYAVLRDPYLRREYDASRAYRRTTIPPRDRPPHAAEPPPSRRPTPPPAAEVVTYAPEPEPSWWSAPFRAISTAYFLLPGPYEWEPGHDADILTTFAIPLLGLAAWELASGRLTALVSRYAYGVPIAWALLAALALPLYRKLPRLLPIVVPSGALMLGLLDAPLASAQIPGWLAWAAIAIVGVVISARMYIFSILPTLVLCQILARVS